MRNTARLARDRNPPRVQPRIIRSGRDRRHEMVGSSARCLWIIPLTGDVPKNLGVAGREVQAADSEIFFGQMMEPRHKLFAGNSGSAANTQSGDCLNAVALR